MWLGRLGKPKIISIHALAKRATAEQRWIRRKENISIHALAKRATIASRLSNVIGMNISIHALAKRATRGAV